MKLWLVMLALFSVQSHAGRLVVAGGDITEIVHALGAGAELVAVDSTSRWPGEVTALPNIGYVRSLSVEGIVALKPDLVLLSHDAGPDRAVSRLSRLVQVARLAPNADPDSLPDRVIEVARLIGRDEAGEQLAAALRTRLDRLREQVDREASPSVLFLLATGSHGVMAAGQDTSAHRLVSWLGWRNVVSLDGFKPLSQEAAMTLRPDLIVVAETQPGSFRIQDHPALLHTPAVRDGRVLVADSMWLLGTGPRLPDALQAVSDLAGERERGQWSAR